MTPLLAAVDWEAVALAAVAAIFGGGGLVALLRLPKDASKIVVDAAQGAVIVQSGVIDDLREELASLKARVAELEGAAREAARLRRELEVVTAERDDLLEANDALQLRVQHLEERLAELERRLD